MARSTSSSYVSSDDDEASDYSDSSCGDSSGSEETAEGATESTSQDSPSTLTLPLELIQHIVRLVPDKRTLARCCRVHSSLLDIARETLYSEVVMDFNYLKAWLHPPRCARLYRRLKRHAHLAALVRTFKAQFRNVEPFEALSEWGLYYFEFQDGGGASEDQWAEEFSEVKGIDLEGRLQTLLGLPNLEELVVHEWDTSYRITPFLAGRVYPSITSLRGMAFSPALVAVFPSLASLSTSLSAVTAYDSSWPAPPPLRELDVRPTWKFSPVHPAYFEWLVSTSSSTLTSLAILFTDSFAPSLSYLTSLHHLVLDNARDYRDPLSTDVVTYEPLPQNSLPALPPGLQSLTLGRLVTIKEKPRYDPVTALFRSAFDRYNFAPSPPPPPSTLDDSFLSSFSCPSLSHLLIGAPHLSAPIYAALVASSMRLPRLKSVRVLPRRWAERELDKTEGWGADEFEQLRSACEERGVRLCMPEKVEIKSKRFSW
ncbi:hypothetical protein JCM6882_002924 [Rhodosporidiobolus microsporus]